MRRRWPLRLRIALAASLAVVVAVSGMAVGAYALVSHELDRSLNLQLQRQVTRVVRQQEARPGSWSPSGPCAFLAAPACVQKVTTDGDVEPGGKPRLPVTPGTRAVAAGQRPAYFSDITVDGHPARMLTAELSPGTAVQVAVRSDRTEQSLNRIGTALLAAALIGVAVATVAGFLVARGGLAPVTEVTRAAQRVATTRDPRQRIDVTGNDEVTRLASSFNTMLAELGAALEALEQSLAAQKSLVADASHELRTPLTGLRTNIDLLTRGDRLTEAQRSDTVVALREQSSELTGLVTDLIDLARGDVPDDASTEEVRLDHLVHHCTTTARRHWPGVTFDVDCEETVIDGRPDKLTRAVTNLLDNAAKFSPEGGNVHIRLRDRELSVRDHGPGIAPEHLDRVFDRFYRAPTTRDVPGSGLGLAIVGQVAAAHHATVSAHSPTDGGALVRVDLRLAAGNDSHEHR